MHHCEAKTPFDAYGPAVTECWEAPDDDHGQPAELAGTLWVGNGEYWSQVSFCPFCGFKATTPATLNG